MTVAALLAGSPLLLQAACLLLGLLVGSFLNVVIHRLPRMLERQWQREAALLQGQEPDPLPRYDLIQPRSACPACHAPIAARHNVPVLSWLWLRGRCHHCKAPISARYPLVELFTALASAVVAWRFGYGAATLLGLLLTWALIALALIDLDTQLLPDAITQPFLWLGLLSAHFGLLGLSPKSSLLGAVIGYMSFWLVANIYLLLSSREGLGQGDMKLLALLGAWMGPMSLIPLVLLASTSGALFGLWRLKVSKDLDIHEPIAFGPFLILGAFTLLIVGPQHVLEFLALSN